MIPTNYHNCYNCGDEEVEIAVALRLGSAGLAYFCFPCFRVCIVEGYVRHDWETKITADGKGVYAACTHCPTRTDQATQIEDHKYLAGVRKAFAAKVRAASVIGCEPRAE